MSALIFLNLLILFLPSQLALHFWPSWSHVFGVRVDYLSPTIFFTDILVWGLIVSSYSAILSLLKRNKKVLFVFLLLSLFNIIFSTLPLLSLVKWLKVFEYLLLVCYTSLYPQRVLKSIYKYLPTSLGITLLLSFAQIYSNHTLGGFFYLLGERSFSVNTPGIALYDFLNKNIIRPYATFPHPNVLAGFSLVTAILFFRKNAFTFLISFTLLIFAFSQNAWIGALGCFSFLMLRNYRHINKVLCGILFVFVLFSLLSPLIPVKQEVGESLRQRVFLNTQAENILAKSPFFGVGLGNFIPNLERRELLQPVHNIYLLIATELGLVGLGLFSVGFGYLILRIKNKLSIFCILAILITSLFDHYWLTLQQTALLASFVLGLAITRKAVKI